MYRVIPRCYRQFFRYRYFSGIRFAGFSVFRSVSIPPFFVYFPPFLPPFFQKGVELLKKGAIAPLLREKGGTAPFLILKWTNRIFLRYQYGKYREIPTEYRPKIPNRYTTLVRSGGDGLTAGGPTGMVQAWVGHFVTPLKRR